MSNNAQSEWLRISLANVCSVCYTISKCLVETKNLSNLESIANNPNKEIQPSIFKGYSPTAY